jgi:hypothetical protein
VAEREGGLNQQPTRLQAVDGCLSVRNTGWKHSMHLSNHFGRVNWSAVGTLTVGVEEIGCVSASTAGRAYTAGGSKAFNSTLLVWDTDSYALLRVISKRSSSWVRCVCCHMFKPAAATFGGGGGGGGSPVDTSPLDGTLHTS